MISPLRTLIIVIVEMITSVDPHMAMYGMPPPPPPPMHVGVPVPMPMPVPVPVPFAVLVSDSKSGSSGSSVATTTTTTTTTQKTILGLPIPVAVPVPMQVPMQLPYSFPAFPSTVCQKARPPGCPPCPPCLCFPSCTPAFFSYCSPCHQQCRCRRKEETPVPVPMAPPAPPPLGPPAYGVAYGAPMARPMVFVIPFPPPLFKSKSDKTRGSSSSELLSSDTDRDIESEESSGISCDISSSREKKKRKKKKKKKVKRRAEEIIVQPFLSFVSRDGDVKMSRRLSSAQAVHLLRGNHDNFDYRISERDNFDNDISERDNLDNNINKRNNFDNRISKRDKSYNGRRSNVQHRRRQVFLPRRMAQRLLKNDMKSLVFKPPPGATISNLSMSFQISPE